MFETNSTKVALGILPVVVPFAILAALVLGAPEPGPVVIFSLLLAITIVADRCASNEGAYSPAEDNNASKTISPTKERYCKLRLVFLSLYIIRFT